MGAKLFCWPQGSPGIAMMLRALLLTGLFSWANGQEGQAMLPEEKSKIRDQIVEMFDHAYGSYMKYAYPADELMPLSCRGRVRGLEPNRGDIDDSLGKFSLTLIDTLDTLVVLNKLDEFEDAVRRTLRDVRLDNDVVVSVFETNIRVLGGLLGAHTMADMLRQRGERMQWYRDELLHMAKELGNRLLPAFNTTSGLPYPRVNLRYGVLNPMSRTGTESDTCTACAGTMILEFAALSRLSGEAVFEENARKALDVLWEKRQRGSDLVGTVINIHNGDWVRRGEPELHCHTLSRSDNTHSAAQTTHTRLHQHTWPPTLTFKKSKCCWRIKHFITSHHVMTHPLSSFISAISHFQYY
ncbi:unnamed protein product [Oncorhynchus mykiss]|uniref:alpha-1,2-Mannosidase n=1 Tax=Oncorhynchus mykiss TaxID=8022 RepID=A0A060XLN3_ONCMY|nr:unnamed protein product [Oncorhynchus mykiss]